jgi:transposase
MSNQLPNPEEELTRRWAHQIMQVLSGQKKAADVVREMGVSRKTYYQREKRALQGMMQALSEKKGGRPPNLSDPQKEALLQENAQLQNELKVLKQTLEIRDIIAAMETPSEPKKKP